MAKAYVVMTCDLGSETSIIESLKKIEGVKEAHGILGLYDLIVHIELDSEKEIQDTITKIVRKIPKIKSTMTMTRAESEELFLKPKTSGSGTNSSQAYLMIHCNKGDEYPTLKNLCSIPEVKEADVVFGLYDVICKLESSDEESLQNAILKKVRIMPVIKTCMTLNIVN
jgi:DNA-binding Lrp family transcriptional regulator